MEKVKKSNIIVLQKVDNKYKQFMITVRPKSKGFETRMTLKIVGGGKNPRISAYAACEEDAVYNILIKIKIVLMEYKKIGLLNKDLSIKIYKSILKSIEILKIENELILQEVANILKLLSNNDIPKDINIENHNTKNTKIPNINNYKHSSCEENTSMPMIAISAEHIVTKDFNSVSLEWFKYKLSLIEKTEENPKPLSPKTIEGYNKTLRLVIQPHFKNNKNILFVTEEDIKKCITSVSGFRDRDGIYIELKMIFAYAKEKGYISQIPNIYKPQEPYTDCEEELIFIESSRQGIWLDKFEEKNTDSSLLFETMLLTGCRPEEACGLKWRVLNVDTDEVTINNAFKDIPIYNENAEIIGHERRDDRLKTPESYRTIPLNPRLKRRLLEQKEKQKLLFKMYSMKWTDQCYMFLNQHRQPYVAENLSASMRRFRAKYELEYMTPYGLRHSFATFCSENGMEEIVLMRLMGHTDFNTTQKYYIVVSKERKKRAIADVYKKVFEREEAV